MKRLLILLAVPFILAAPVYAAPLSAEDLTGDTGRDIRSEVEAALSGASGTETSDIEAEVEEALAGTSGTEAGDIEAEVEEALAGTSGTEANDIEAEVAEALAGAEEDAYEDVSDEVWTPQEIRYQFEHSMLPRYFYDVPENMLNVIVDPGIYALWESVSVENGADPTYSEKEYVTHWYRAADDTVIAQVELPEPDRNTLCYRIYFVYNAEENVTGYYTVEYDNLFGECSFICTWDADRTHTILGDAEILDKNSSSYAAELQEEAKLIAGLAGVSAELVSIDDTMNVPNTAALSEIACPEQGFSVMADPAYSWDYQEGTGLSIYTEYEGSIPYVIVYQGEDLIAEPFDYIKEQYTPHMQEQYGSDLISVEECEDLDIGGKTLPAGMYTYRSQDYTIDMLRIYDSTGKRTVAYTAKYIDGEGEATLAALDTAISSFKAD